MYVPILKGKKGEFTALRKLSARTRGSAVPLVELPPLPPAARPTPKKPNPKRRTLQDHLGKSFAEPLGGAADGMRVWIDPDQLRVYDPDLQTRSVQQLFGDVADGAVEFVPVIRPSSPPAMKTALFEIAVETGRGLVVRVAGEDLDDASSAIATIVDQSGVTIEDVDLVIDLGTSNVSAPVQAQTSAAVLNLVPQVESFRSLVLASAAFPDSLAALGANSATLLPRTDWLAWSRIASGQLATARIPTYSDYGAAGPSFPETQYRGAPNIRYTTDDSWYVLRGNGAKRAPVLGEQHFSLAAQMRESGYLVGDDCCWGDQYIGACSPTEAGPGGSTEWRAVATNHHIEFATRQLANQAEP